MWNYSLGYLRDAFLFCTHQNYARRRAPGHAGRKPDLIRSLMDMYRDAAAAGLTPKEFRWRQLEEQATAPSQPRAVEAAKRVEAANRLAEERPPNSSDFGDWTLQQLRAGLRKRRITPRGACLWRVSHPPRVQAASLGLTSRLSILRIAPCHCCLL